MGTTVEKLERQIASLESDIRILKSVRTVVTKYGSEWKRLTHDIRMCEAKVNHLNRQINHIYRMGSMAVTSEPE